MPIYSGDKLGFGVSPATGDEDVGPGYSTSFSNKSHNPKTEHKWVVPFTGRYNFEVWGADGGMGVRGDSNSNGGIPKYGKGGKVETSLQLTAGTEIGILIGGEGRPAYAYSSGQYLDPGIDGWGGSIAGKAVEDLCSGGNSQWNHNTFGGQGSPTNRKGAGGGGGTIVRLFDGYTDADFLIVAGGGGGAGARGDDNNNSNNQGGAGGNANNKSGEDQWGRRGWFAGDTSYGWPSGNATAAQNGDSSNGGNGGNGYYAGGAGGGGGCGGGGGGATCQYCGSSPGNGGSCGNDGARGNGYTESSGGTATSQSTTTITVVGSGGNSTANGMAHGGGGGGGYRGGGAGYWGNGSGHAGGGGGGGASSYVTDSSTYDAKGLNAIEATPRYTSDQKPISLGNPGGGLVKIWEANKDPLGKQRPAELLASKIQYTSRSTNCFPTPQYYLSSATQVVDGGGGYDYNAWATGGWSVNGANDCDAIVMNVSGEGTWELHSITVGQSNGDYEYPYPYKHQAWIHVIEGTTTGGVGIHTEKFDNGRGTAWYAHYKACTSDYNTAAGYIEVHLDEPAVLERGQDYTIALDYSCGGTTSQGNQAQIRHLGNSHRTTADLEPASLGTVTWSNVTSFNGPHGLGTDNGTSTTQGQMVQFGVRSYTKSSGAGGGGATYVTNGLVFNVDASESSSYSGSGNTWTDIAGSNNVTLQNCGYTSDHGGGITFLDNGNWSIGEFTTPVSASSPQSWEVWTNGIQSSGFPGSPYTWILHNNNSAQSTGSSYHTMGLNDANEFFGAFDGQFTSMNYTGANSSISTVYHLIMTWDGSTQKFYVDGTERRSLALGAYNTWSNNTYNTTTTMGEAIGGNYRPLDGPIYSVRVWNKALTGAEVTTNWNGNKAKFNR